MTTDVDGIAAALRTALNLNSDLDAARTHAAALLDHLAGGGDPPAGATRADVLRVGRRALLTPRRVATDWEAWDHDGDGGYTHRGVVRLALAVALNNALTPEEFESAAPSDAQVARAFGATIPIDTYGDDTMVVAFPAGYETPVGFLRCVSHESLSPVRRAGVAREQH